MAEFKKISEVEVVEAPSENDTLLLVSDGEVKQVPAVNFAAASGGGSAPIRLIAKSTGGFRDSNYTLEDGSPVPSNLVDIFLSGTPVYIQYMDQNAIYNNVWCAVIGADKHPSASYLFFFNLVDRLNVEILGFECK